VRILHVVPTYVPAWRHGGTIKAVHGLTKALAARGHEVSVFTTDVHADGTLGVPLGEPVNRDSVEVLYFPVRPPRRLYRSPAMAEALARAVPACDLVHLHSVFLWPTYAAARAAERAGVPFLLSPRGMLVPDLLRRRGRLRKHLWLRLVERRTLLAAAGLHATSDLEAAQAALLGLYLPPVHVVPNGVEAEPLAEGAQLSPGVRSALARPPLLLFLGRVSWKKGLDRLIPALTYVREATLAIAGNDEEGYRPALERLARLAGVADRVLHLGPVHGADKAALLHGATALVLPSYSENFGNVVLEAMAAGCPTVVTPEVGLAETVRETGAGLVCDGDPLRLGTALRDLVADPEGRREMGRRGVEAAERRFGWPAVAERMEEVYAGVLHARRHGRAETRAASAGVATP